MQHHRLSQLFLLVVGCHLLVSVYGHTHHLHNANKEKVEHGAKSPRDHGHLGENGEHNTAFDHESILGSSKAAEEFDDLPLGEAKRRLEILVLKMDRNNDKQVDRTELHSWILRSFKMLSEEESEERMDEVDEDEDGYVTWAEYIAETYGIKEPEDQELLDPEDQDEEKKLLREDRELFNGADRNIDGRLDSAEFLSFTHPEEHPNLLPIILMQTLRDKDKNSDGVIDFQEFIGEKGDDDDSDGDTDREFVRKQKSKFGKMDKNNNGTLETDEIRPLVEMAEDIAEDEVDHLFASTDDDNDDFLSFLEILDHHDIFVGSEATDYGDHLHNLDRFEDEL